MQAFSAILAGTYFKVLSSSVTHIDQLNHYFSHYNDFPLSQNRKQHQEGTQDGAKVDHFAILKTQE